MTWLSLELKPHLHLHRDVAEIVPNRLPHTPLPPVPGVSCRIMVSDWRMARKHIIRGEDLSLVRIMMIVRVMCANLL